MKISYRTAGTGSYTVLGDESDRSAIISGFDIEEGLVAQVEAKFRATNRDVYGRGNAVWSLSVTVERVHADLGAALEFQVTHAAALPQVVDLKIEQGAKTVYMAGAVMTRFKPVPAGLSSVCFYSWVGATYLATAPS